MINIKILIFIGLYLLLCLGLSFSNIDLKLNNKKIKNKFERFYYLVWIVPLAFMVIIFSLLLIIIFIGIILLVVGMPLWIVIAILIVIF